MTSPGDDLRMSAATLEYQADLAQKSGNQQLAENLRRAAELVDIDDAEVLDLYEALRPGRSTPAELRARAVRLRERGAVRLAAVVDEAARHADR